MMREARFLVFCSAWYEGFPMVIVEGFASGIPVICPRLGAMRDLVADGQTGLHYEAVRSAELAEKVAWAWTHKKEMKQMGWQARKEYESKYTAEKNHEIVIDIYQEAIRTSQGKAPAVPHAPLSIETWSATFR